MWCMLRGRAEMETNVWTPRGCSKNSCEITSAMALYFVWFYGSPQARNSKPTGNFFKCKNSSAFYSYGLHFIVTVAASSGNCNVTVWRPSVCPVFSSNFKTARGAYSMWLTRDGRGQHATRPAYISVRVLPGRTYLLINRYAAKLAHFHIWAEFVFRQLTAAKWRQNGNGNDFFCETGWDGMRPCAASSYVDYWHGNALKHSLKAVNNAADTTRHSNRKLSTVMALSTTFTQCVPETTKFGKITQNKGHFAFNVIVQRQFIE